MPLLIRDSIITTGSQLLSNKDILDIYDGNNKKPIDFLEHIGRDKRYHCNGVTENTLSMGNKVALEILEKNNLKGEDIDLIAFCSQYPEYTVPSQSLLVHNHIRGKSRCVTLDINANCLGMLRGLDLINRYFNDKHGGIKKALLIGSDCMSRFSDSSELVNIGGFGDGACALLLEYTEKEDEGVIGSSDRSISNEVFDCMYPRHGSSNVSKYSYNDTLTSWSDPDTSISIDAMKDALDDILVKHNMNISDIDWFCGSQFAKQFFDSIANRCDISTEKRIYVGDKYGYTGTSSPFFAFNEGFKEGRIKKGDVVFFTTVGVGISVCSMLLRV